MTKLVIQLETLTCPTCVNKIEDTLNRYQGVQKATLLFNLNRVKATFDESIVTADKLKKVVEELGYQVKTIKTA